MKTLLTTLILFLALTCSAQSYISADTDIILESGSLTKYTTPNLFITGTYQVRAQRWIVSIGVSSGATANEPIFAEYTLILTKETVDAYTGTGTGDTETAQNALEQAVGGYLGALNATTTFTIH